MILEVTEQEIMLIGTALSELPFKTSAGLIIKLQNQVNQQRAAEEPKKDE